MGQRESRLSRDIMNKVLRPSGVFCFKVWGSEHMMAGLPDIIGCYKGRFIALETKMPDKRNNTSARQDLVMGRIRDAGGVAEVVCGVKEVKSLLESLANEMPDDE